MKNVLLRGATVLVLGGLFAGCSHDDMFNSSVVDGKLKAYQEVFVDAYGRIDPQQDWGFKNQNQDATNSNAATRALFHSQATPTCPHMDVNAAKALAAEILAKSTELDETNNNNNSPGYYWYNSDTDNGIVMSSTYIINYLISGTWTGLVNQLPTIGNKWSGNWAADHTPETELVPRTLYVSGKWVIPTGQTQSCGQGQGALPTDGIIIVGPEGEIEVNGTLNMNNQARLIVLPGGKITGTGSVQVNNGNAVGNENYNGGIITVAKFNNNFGKFYNYGEFRATQYIAGGSGSIQGNATCFFNHGLVHINNGGVPGTYVSTNARIFNACQWYCEQDMRAYIIEEVAGASFIVDGELQMSCGNDGSNDPTYVALAAGALVKCGTLYNNGTNWTGPTDGGYAVVSAGMITYLNWEQDTQPLAGGYFENNIYMQVDDLTNIPDGNGYHAGETATAEWKFKYIVANGLGGGTTARGNGNVTLISTGNTVIIPADANFVKGTRGCTPGFLGNVSGTVQPETIPIDQGSTSEDRITILTTIEHYETSELIEQGRVFCEDLGQISTNDLDFNDVVFDAYVYKITPSTRTLITEDGVVTTDQSVDGAVFYRTEIVLLAAGGELQLSLAGFEVHNKLGNNPVNTLINTITSDNVLTTMSRATYDPVVLGADFNYSSIVSIPIRVLYGSGEALELTAEQGWAPHKILVPIGTKWCRERVNIADAYTNFKDYVGTSSKFWNGTIDESGLYIHPKDNYTERSTTAVKRKISTVGPTTSYRNKGSQTTTGGYQGETILSRKGNNLFND